MNRPVVAVFVSSLLLLASLITSADAQEPWVVRLQGRVLWTAGQTMVLAVDEGPAINIDLRRVPQGDFLTLGTNDYVVVTGLVVRGSRQFIATSIQRALAPYGQSP
ncbi:MAG: hypothetical protein HYU25_00905 [Candidatus Rokubacteria bacterium]|nr:hypothetical protein [Candidatus Rokubacteria bacterium]